MRTHFIQNPGKGTITPSRWFFFNSITKILAMNRFNIFRINIRFYPLDTWIESKYITNTYIFGFKNTIELNISISSKRFFNKYNGRNFIEKVAVTDLVKKVPFYLRGIDFTDQIIDLLGNQKIMASVNDALGVNIIMNKILNNENNSRR